MTAALTYDWRFDCSTLQHTATNRNTLHRTATHRNTLQHTAMHSWQLLMTGGLTSTHCNTLQPTATHCNTPMPVALLMIDDVSYDWWRDVFNRLHCEFSDALPALLFLLSLCCMCVCVCVCLCVGVCMFVVCIYMYVCCACVWVYVCECVRVCMWGAGGVEEGCVWGCGCVWHPHLCAYICSCVYTCTPIVMCCSLLQCVAVCCSVLQCIAVHYSVLQCLAMCCSVLQCIALCLQCVAARCSVLPSVGAGRKLFVHEISHENFWVIAKNCVSMKVSVCVCASICFNAYSSVCVWMRMYVFRYENHLCGRFLWWRLAPLSAADEALRNPHHTVLCNVWERVYSTHCSTLQRTATHCNTLQDTATPLHHTRMTFCMWSWMST